MNQKQIPTSNSKEDIKAREKIIVNFYHEWKRNNPSQKLYNLDLKDYINVRYISIVETVEHSSKKLSFHISSTATRLYFKISKKS